MHKYCNKKEIHIGIKRYFYEILFILSKYIFKINLVITKFTQVYYKKRNNLLQYFFNIDLQNFLSFISIKKKTTNL